MTPHTRAHTHTHLSPRKCLLTLTDIIDKIGLLTYIYFRGKIILKFSTQIFNIFPDQSKQGKKCIVKINATPIETLGRAGKMNQIISNVLKNFLTKKALTIWNVNK